uniref:Galectin n=1 Tax=Mola mola TaxID=94237 RepID=A0A3Q3W2Q1_MOLML
MWPSLSPGFPAWPGQTVQPAPCWPGQPNTACWPGAQPAPYSVPAPVSLPAPVQTVTPAPAPATTIVPAQVPAQAPAPGQPCQPCQPCWPGTQCHPPQPPAPLQPQVPAPIPSPVPVPAPAPSVPYNLNLARGVYDKMMMTILGHVKPNAKIGNDIAFHINPRFNEGGKQIVVRNHKVGERWGTEERELKGPFPFALGSPFEMKILCSHEAFRVAVNNIPLFEFQHRVRDLNRIDRINILHDVVLTYRESSYTSV